MQMYDVPLAVRFEAPLNEVFLTEAIVTPQLAAHPLGPPGTKPILDILAYAQKCPNITSRETPRITNSRLLAATLMIHCVEVTGTIDHYLASHHGKINLVQSFCARLFSQALALYDEYADRFDELFPDEQAKLAGDVFLAEEPWVRETARAHPMLARLEALRHSRDDTRLQALAAKAEGPLRLLVRDVIAGRGPTA